MGVIRIWEYLRGITIWCCWILRNDLVFEGTTWSTERIQSYVWDGLQDYGRVKWGRTLLKDKRAKSPEKVASVLGSFDAAWTLNDLLCRRNGLSVSWLPRPMEVPIIMW